MPLRLRQSAWQDHLDLTRMPAQRFIGDYTIAVFPLDRAYEMEYGPSADWYWRVELGKTRINGGLCYGASSGRSAADRAIYMYEWQEFKELNYWDSETCSWVRRGELPPLE